MADKPLYNLAEVFHICFINDKMLKRSAKCCRVGLKMRCSGGCKACSVKPGTSQVSIIMIAESLQVSFVEIINGYNSLNNAPFY